MYKQSTYLINYTNLKQVLVKQRIKRPLQSIKAVKQRETTSDLKRAVIRFISQQFKFSSTPTMASSTFCFTSTEARRLIRDGDGEGGGWEGDERVKARPRVPPEKDRRDRGPPPEQWKC